MLGHVNELHRPTDGFHHGVPQRLRLTNDGEYTAVVILIPGVVQKPDPGLAPEAVAELFNDCKIPALAEIGYTFQNLIHDDPSFHFSGTAKAILSASLEYSAPSRYFAVGADPCVCPLVGTANSPESEKTERFPAGRTMCAPTAWGTVL